MLNKKTLTEARVYLEKNILPITEEAVEKAAENGVVTSIHYEVQYWTHKCKCDMQYIAICLGIYFPTGKEHKTHLLDFCFGFLDSDEETNEKALRRLQTAMEHLKEGELELACKAFKNEEK